MAFAASGGPAAAGRSRPGQTKVFIYYNDDPVAYLFDLKIPAEQVTLGDVKQLTDRPGQKYDYFLKAHEPGKGDVKRLVSDDAARLEALKGQIVLHLISKGGTAAAANVCSDHDSVDSSRSSQGLLPQRRSSDAPLRNPRQPAGGVRMFPVLGRGGSGYNSATNSVRQSEQTNRGFETESTISFDSHRPTSSLSDSEYCGSSRASTIGPGDMTSLPRNSGPRRKRFTKRPNLVRASSASSVADSVSTVSHSMTVKIHREHGGSLGIELYEKNGFIYVKNVLKGCAAFERIHANDCILEVNNHRLDGLNIDEATQLLRQITMHPGPISLKVVQVPVFDNPDENDFPRGRSIGDSYSSMSGPNAMPLYSPGEPYVIDPVYGLIGQPQETRPRINFDEWLAGAEAGRSSASLAPTSLCSEVMEPRFGRDTVKSEPLYGERLGRLDVVKRMASSESGLEVKNRIWLKIEIQNAFMGRNLIKWLKDNVNGLTDAKLAKRFALQILEDGFIQQTMGTKNKFSEKAYYTFDPLVTESDCSSGGLYMAMDGSIDHELVDDIPDSVSQVATNQSYFRHPVTNGYHFPPSSSASGPPRRRGTNGSHSSGGSANSAERRLRAPIFEETSSQLSQLCLQQQQLPGMHHTPQDVAGSRQTFKMAMGKY
ncbi:putative Segment polarity protein dishevelled-like protein DVL-3 [Hypsibius exemplaris]|uniref:Segment polarity protein dishevelled-like protein DVL-3 n=1 Tax=Hypsibius exemplaris TaxID=2072580 RepID=A0A1W0X6V6_HYPEX|nr:putative Segment polarity protein dishevelled-like protein DVL-3 [Hypsibius exemplaris]